MTENKKIFTTPKVRKFARELGANVSMIEGSERKGRITEEDVKKFINKQINDQQNNKKEKQIVNIEKFSSKLQFFYYIYYLNKNNIGNSILTLGVPNRFVDHGPRNILLEEIGLDSMTLFEKIYNFSRKSNE